MKRIIAAALCALVFGACGLFNQPPRVVAGDIIARSYDDPDDWTTLECGAYGKYGCSWYYNVHHHDGPHWEFQLECGDTRTWVQVADTEWDRWHAGDFYSINEGGSTEGACEVVDPDGE